ncbi:MAG: penicillin-binding protein [Candidatus Binataceae bacterium]
MNAAFKQRRSRILGLTLVLASLFVAVILRLAVLVMFDGPRLSSIARSEHTERLDLAAVRGPIVDRHGEALALSAESRSIYARPQDLIDNTSAQERARLAVALGLPSAQLEARLSRRRSFVWLARQVERERADAVEALDFDGVDAVPEYKRYNPESNLAAAVVGMAGMDGQGLSGIELQYDSLLRGTPVVMRINRDALGHQIFDSPLVLKNPEPGARLELTIDAAIQALAEKELDAQLRSSGARRGSAVVLDPFTGEVLALAGAASGDADERLHQSAVQDAFEPGSTIKGILGAVALENGVITPDREIFCENGAMNLDGRTIHDHGRHQWLNLSGIIEVSSNIGAAKIALALGAQRYYEGLKAFGFGSRTGIDLPGEAEGLVRAPNSWKSVDLANHGFGQGIAVTPIQLAAAYAAIANGGQLMRPFVVRAAFDNAGNEILRHTPQVMRRVVSPAVAHDMNRLLREVVNGADGTGRRARVADFTVAGKTGTAQMPNPTTGGYYQNRLVASFVGFVPADDPRLVILIVLEDVGEGHEGGLVAAPVFSAIAAGALGRLEVAANPRGYESASLLGSLDAITSREPSDESSSAAPDAAAVSPEPALTIGTAPDFVGLSLRAALRIARRSGVKLEIEGQGYVMAQAPAPGLRMGKSPIKLTLAAVSMARWSGDDVAKLSGRPVRASAKMTLAAVRRRPPRGD